MIYTGIDHLDTKYLNTKNIKWFCAEGSNSLSVINYVMSAICYLKRENLFNINDSVGIVGCGNIGKKVNGINPGSGYLRISLVDTSEIIEETMKRLSLFLKNYNHI